jgi:hypothetical protein
MKNISTGFGLCVAAAAALAYPFVSSLAPSANASAVTAAASAVSTAAAAQTGPTIVWYGTARAAYDGEPLIIRAWSDGRLEGLKIRVAYTSDCSPGATGSGFVIIRDGCGQGWQVISSPSQGLTYRSDINFDAKVDGADLGQLLADWGDAPRQDIPPSDCPLNLINP